MNHIIVKQHSRTAALCVLFCMALGMACTAKAQTWVASTGTVDESSLLTYQFTDGAAFIRPSHRPGKVILRFNVLPVGNLAVRLTHPCCEGRALWVRFLDNDGDGAQVIVELKRLNVFTGEITTLLSFDSNDFPPQPTFQQAGPFTGLGAFFNFSFADGPTEGGQNLGGDSAYFIEATLIRSESGGNPGLASVSIVTTLAP